MIVTRICKCGGTATGEAIKVGDHELHTPARIVYANVKCSSCGRTFNAKVGRLEEWNLIQIKNLRMYMETVEIMMGRKLTEGERLEIINPKEYYEKRKAWAREVLKKNNLASPGTKVKSRFKGNSYVIKIGPRRGVKIRKISSK